MVCFFKWTRINFLLIKDVDAPSAASKVLQQTLWQSPVPSVGCLPLQCLDQGRVTRAAGFILFPATFPLGARVWCSRGSLPLVLVMEALWPHLWDTALVWLSPGKGSGAAFAGLGVSPHFSREIT